jgi:hypothetical protein
MKTIRTAALAVAVTVGLSGCVGLVQDAVQGALQEVVPPEIQQLLGRTTDFSFDVPVSTDVPSDWPESVSIPDGQVLFGYADDSTWNLAVSVEDTDSAVAGLEALQANGFGVVSEQVMGNLQVTELTNGTLNVTYAYVGEGSAVVINLTVTTVES